MTDIVKTVEISDLENGYIYVHEILDAAEGFSTAMKLQIPGFSTAMKLQIPDGNGGWEDVDAVRIVTT